MNEKTLETKLNELYRLLLSLNAYGSLDLKDLNLIVNQLEKSFSIKLSD
jgi:hypothetical protein